MICQNINSFRNDTDKRTNLCTVLDEATFNDGKRPSSYNYTSARMVNRCFPDEKLILHYFTINTITAHNITDAF